MKLLALIAFSTLPFFASLIYFLPKEPAPGFLILLGATKLFIFLSPFLFWKFLKLPGSWKDFPKLFIEKKIFRQIIVGIVVGLLMCAAVLIPFELLSEETRTEALKRIAAKISVLKISEHFLIYGIVLSFVHSLLEEFYWRFFVFNAWKAQLHKGTWHLSPHIIAGLAFALHHFTVTVHYFDLGFGIILGLGVWAGGVIWSLVYEKERSLLGVWISHILVDIALISIGFKALNL